MFKRTVKLTALLVGVAAITSIFSAVSADAIIRLESKEGKFESAVANYGKYIYDGYKEDNDSDIYVSDGNEDKAIENADDYSGNYNIKCGDKYVFAFESGDTYLTDISSGTILENSTVEDMVKDLAKALKRKIKNTDRYGKNVKFAEPLQWIKTNSFGEVWYKYVAVPSEDAEEHKEVTEDHTKLYGFVNSDGNYIDVCCKANLVVVSGEKTIKIDEFGKEKSGITATLESINAITQDKDYIYTLTKVKIYGDETEGSQTFIQKISKTSDGNKDGANIPKTLNSYMVTNIFDGEDDDKAVQELNIFNPYADYFTAVNGTLYLAHKNSDTELKLTKFNMKKEKASLSDNLNNKLDVYTVKVDDDEKHDITKGSNISIDIYGNVWGINKGKIFKAEDLKANDVYSCDTSYDRLDVFNEKNLVVWNTTDEVYSEVVNGPEVAKVNASEVKENEENDTDIGKKSSKPENKIVTGWIQDNGKWYLKNSDGTNKSGWYNESSNWYYFNNNGEMQTGMIYIEEKGYYLNPKCDGSQGVMKKGWENINGDWYYFNPVNNSNGFEGMMLTGWENIDDNWYYFYNNGKMAFNTEIDGYYVNNSGQWVK